MGEFNLEQAPSQQGKIAIVTGANSGVGYETAKGLASKGAKVIMACRNLEKAESARQEILKELPDADMVVMQLELDKLSSVRAFAEAFKQKYQQLHLLINNAGIMIPPFSKTEDGFESQMGVNYFSHFLLTSLLFELLDNTQGARVVTLSSIAHKNGKIQFNNLNAEQDYSKMGAYGQSKLACLMFAFELQRRIDSANSHVKSLAAHPGVSNTNLGKHLPFIAKLLVPILAPFFTHAPEKAALPSLYAATGTDVQGGDYVGPTGRNEMKGKPGKVQAEEHAYNEAVARKLWDVSEEMVQQKFVI